LPVKVAGKLGRNTHLPCKRDLCKVVCISDIHRNLNLYLDELSRVLFLKENLYHKAWWLSVFYSFCIQALVRKILIQLAPERIIFLSVTFASTTLEIKQYLYIAIRLFTAMSGTHDPLMRDYSSNSLVLSIEEDHFKLAQLSVKQSEWRKSGIDSSAEYLKRKMMDRLLKTTLRMLSKPMSHIPRLAPFGALIMAVMRRRFRRRFV
jgi:hypothetical protein